MRKMKIRNIVFILLIMSLSACGSNRQDSGQKETAPSVQGKNQSASNPEKGAEHPGLRIYNTVCLACHMANGTGVPGMFPPLAKTDWVTGDKDRLIRITIQGLSGKIEVNGVTYNSIMPPNAHLSNKEIADVLTYIRQSFGNNAGEVTVEEVQRVRDSL